MPLRRGPSTGSGRSDGRNSMPGSLGMCPSACIRVSVPRRQNSRTPSTASSSRRPPSYRPSWRPGRRMSTTALARRFRACTSHSPPNRRLCVSGLTYNCRISRKRSKWNSPKWAGRPRSRPLRNRERQRSDLMPYREQPWSGSTPNRRRLWSGSTRRPETLRSRLRPN